MYLFETERLSARQFNYEDVLALTEILSDPDVMRYSIRGVCDEAATRSFIEFCIESYNSQGFGPWALIDKINGSLVGFCGVSLQQMDGVDEANLGYRLAKSYWGKGLATEAAGGVVKYVFDHVVRDSVIVIIEPEHISSMNVAIKVGFDNFKESHFHNRQVLVSRMSKTLYENQSPAYLS